MKQNAGYFKRASYRSQQELEATGHERPSRCLLSQDFRKFKETSQLEAHQEKSREFAALGRVESMILATWGGFLVIFQGLFGNFF